MTALIRRSQMGGRGVVTNPKLQQISKQNGGNEGKDNTDRKAVVGVPLVYKDCRYQNAKLGAKQQS